MTFEQIIKAAIPEADHATVEHVLWGRTPFPAGPVTARSLYKAASRFKRAKKPLCDWCDRLAREGEWICERCEKALHMDADAECVSYGFTEPQFTGEALLRLVIDIEAAVGSHAAACTPLGRAVMELAEAAANADPELQASKR